MGIHGLWQILEPTGRPVNIHSLRGKVLAVDVSIWLHQLVKGFRDKDGNPLPNAHLLGVFHRLCKLLNYGIKPIFVFDGGVPVLKRQTLAARRQRKLESLDKAELSRQKILSAYLQQQLQRQAKTALPPSLRMQARIAELSNAGGTRSSSSPSPKKRRLNDSQSPKASNNGDDEVDKDLESFRAALVAKLEEDIDEADQTIKRQTDSESDDDSGVHQYRYGVDYSENFSVIQGPDFDTLPLETQHEILFEMQESRKMNSWGKFDKMPKDLQSFSNFQMDRLVKRRTLQKKIQSVQQEMGQRHIHVQNLDDLLKLDYGFEKKETKILGSQEDGFVLIKSQDPKKDSGKSKEKEEPKPGTSKPSSKPEVITIDDFVEDNSSDDDHDTTVKPALPATTPMKKEITEEKGPVKYVDEEEKDLQLAIQLSLAEAGEQQKQKKAMSSASDTKEPIDSSQKSRLCVLQSSESGINNTCEIPPEAKKAGSAPATLSTPLDAMRSSHMSHCAKFLDTIGFHVPLAEPSNSISEKELNKQSETVTSNKVDSESDDDDDDDDFEEVDDGKVSSPSTPIRDNVAVGQSETVASIDLSSIQKASLTKEEDIFADIFGCNEETQEESVSADVTVADESPPVVEENNGQILSKNISRGAESSSEELVALSVPDNVEWGDSDDEIEADLLRIVLAESVAAAEKPDTLLSKPDKDTVGNSQNPPVRSENINASTNKTLSVNQVPQRMITAEYMQAQEQLISKLDRLQSEKGHQERVASSISDQMQVETQELISLFGIPYVVSPTEAESQCAFLDRSCLTEGSITDDSDVWLFGGQRVYKNFFSQGDKRVELYQAADIQRVLNLSREKLIALAMLIGSDYSDGIQGVGPVLALEILSEFSTYGVSDYESLVKFRDWWDQIQEKNSDVFSGSKLKEKLRKLSIRAGFPNRSVYDAFVNPAIDTSTEAFKWGNPDLDGIRGYVKQKFGWDQSKCDSFLLPVLKNLRCEAEQSRQLTLDSYISIGKMPTLKTGKRKKPSKRIENAVKKLKSAGVESHELNLSSDSDSEQESERQDRNFTQKVQVTNRELNVGKRNVTIKKGKGKESQAGSSVSSSAATGTNIERGKTCREIPAIKLHPKPEVIPQRVQAESNRKKNKQKAIEIFSKKKTQ